MHKRPGIIYLEAKVADIGDIANTAALLGAFLRRLTADAVDELAKFLKQH